MSRRPRPAPSPEPEADAAAPRRRPWLPRWARWTLGIVAFVLLAAGLTGMWVVGSESGARWAFEQLGTFLPGELETRRLRGPIRGPLVVDDLSYRTEAFHLTARRVELHWSLRRLLQRRLDIHRLLADDVAVVLLPGPAEPARPDSVPPLPDVDLPLNVFIREGVFRNVAFTQRGARVPIRASEIRLDHISFRDTLGIDRLTMKSDRLDLELRGSAYTHGVYPVDLRMRWTLRLPDRPELVGSGAVAGTFDSMRVNQRLVSPFGATVEGMLFAPVRDLSFDGGATFEALDLRVFEPDLPPWPMTGTVVAQGRPSEFTGRGDVRVRHPEYGLLDADLRLAHTGRTWRFDRAEIVLPGRPTRLLAEGRVTTDEGSPPRFQINASWTRLTWPVRPAGEPLVESREGIARLTGTTASYAISLDGALEGPNMPPGDWKLTGRGNTRAARFETIVGDLLDGTLSGRGTLEWSPRPAWNVALAGESIDPSGAWPAFPGNLDFHLTTVGHAGAGGPQGSVALADVTGTLRDYPVNGHADITLRGPRQSFDTLAVAVGSARLGATGEFGNHWDLSWGLEAPDVGVLVPQSLGSLSASGTIEGPAATPRFTATARGESLATATARATSLAADVDIGSRPGDSLVIRIVATHAQSGRFRPLEHVIATAEGTRGNHEARVALTSGQDSLQLLARGGLGPSAWRGEIHGLDLRAAQTGDWSLERPAKLEASMDHVMLDTLRWASGDARLAAATEWRREGTLRGAVTLGNVALNLFDPLLPPHLDLDGPLNGHVRLDRTPGDIAFDARLEPGPGVIRLPGENNRIEEIRFDRGLFTAHAGSALTSRLELPFPDMGHLTAEFGLPDWNGQGPPRDAEPVTGRLEADFTDLRLLQAFVPDATNVKGALDADIQVRGTVGSPTATGSLVVANAAADVPRVGLELRDIGLEAHGSTGEKMTLRGHVRSGEGTITLDGNADVGRGIRPVAEATLKGTNFTAMDTRDVELIASPDVQARLDGDSLVVTGDVTVPRADIEIRSNDDREVILPSGDVVYVGAPADTTPDRQLAVTTRVRLILGDRVDVKAYGLEASIGGSVLAIDEPGGSTRGSGQLFVREGRYRAYGARLDIERGRLVYAGGPLADPGLDVRAVRHAEDNVTAGFEVRGTLQAPELRVVSDPPMGDTEALAYALTGRSMRDATQSEGRLVDRAANSLGVFGGNRLAGALGEQLGLQQATIESTGPDYREASLMLGTWLSPRLYVSYGLGLFEPVSTLNLRYLLHRMWTIEVESGDEVRGNVFYTVER